MVATRKRQWEALEKRSPRLFRLASAILLVASANYGVAYFLDGVAFNDWVGLAVLVGRVVSLVAIAGLSVQLVNRNPRIGTPSRVVVVAATVVTCGLLTLAILENLGITTSIIAVFGLGTILLSIITYALFGVAIARTGAYPTLVGVLLLAATGGLLVGFFGQVAFPERLIGTVTEGILFVTHLGIGYRLRPGSEPADRPESAAETVAK